MSRGRFPVLHFSNVPEATATTTTHCKFPPACKLQCDMTNHRMLTIEKGDADGKHDAFGDDDDDDGDTGHY